MSRNVVVGNIELISELNLFYFTMKKRHGVHWLNFNICETYWPVENLVHGCLLSSSLDLEIQTLNTLDQNMILFSFHVYGSWKSEHYRPFTARTRTQDQPLVIIF
jgi:hypothetical protein